MLALSQQIRNIENCRVASPSSPFSGHEVPNYCIFCSNVNFFTKFLDYAPQKKAKEIRNFLDVFKSDCIYLIEPKNFVQFDKNKQTKQNKTNNTVLPKMQIGSSCTHMTICPCLCIEQQNYTDIHQTANSILNHFSCIVCK